MSAGERVVMRIAIEDGVGFVSESTLNKSQIETVRRMERRGFVKNAGTEPDGTKVYRATAVGRKEFEGKR